ncbi:hypothetical protein PFISCL1PPCAC_21159, partial [Pristionchus fissidentatus]
FHWQTSGRSSHSISGFLCSNSGCNVPSVAVEIFISACMRSKPSRRCSFHTLRRFSEQTSEVEEPFSNEGNLEQTFSQQI